LAFIKTGLNTEKKNQTVDRRKFPSNLNKQSQTPFLSIIFFFFKKTIPQS